MDLEELKQEKEELTNTIDELKEENEILKDRIKTLEKAIDDYGYEANKALEDLLYVL